MTHRDDEFISAFLRNQADIKRYLVRMTGSHEDSEDLAQEAWIKLSRNQAAAVSPVPYLRRIARSLAIDHDRGRRRRLSAGEVEDILSVPDERPGPEREAEDRDQLRRLMHVIGELPPRQRQILVAARLDLRSHAEIAQFFGVSVRTVEMEIRRALDYCASRLAE